MTRAGSPSWRSSIAWLALAAGSPGLACETGGEVLTARPTRVPDDTKEPGATQEEGTSDTKDASAPPDTASGQFDAGNVFDEVAVVVAASDHSCMLQSGRVYCTGANASGQLGLSDPEPVPAMRAIVSTQTADLVVAGYGYTCVRLTDGQVGCFGLNDRGQLGSGDHTSRYELQMVALPAAVKTLSTKFGTVCAVLDAGSEVAEGTVYCWGANENNQCGTGTFVADDDEATPVVPILDVAAQQISVGRGHTCVLSDADELWCWGSNGSHELGLGPDAPGLTIEPSRVSDLHFAQVAAGQNHTCAITTNRELYCWGDVLDADGHPGPMGHDDLAAHDTPARVGEDSGWVYIATDTFHSCGLRGDGELWCWGRNAEGQLGVGSAEVVPSRVRINPEERFTSVAVGRFHTCALRDDGVALCAGKNENGELASGDVMRRATLTPIQ